MLISWEVLLYKEENLYRPSLVRQRVGLLLIRSVGKAMNLLKTETDSPQNTEGKKWSAPLGNERVECRLYSHINEVLSRDY